MQLPHTAQGQLLSSCRWLLNAYYLPSPLRTHPLTIPASLPDRAPLSWYGDSSLDERIAATYIEFLSGRPCIQWFLYIAYRILTAALRGRCL